MKKEDILEISRKENRNKDIYLNEVLKEGRSIGAIVAVIIATVFFVIQIFVGGGLNYGLYAVIFSMFATNYVVKAIKMKSKFEIVLAIFYIIIALMLSFIHIYQLINASTIL